MTRLILSTGEAIYPNFLSKEGRIQLENRMKAQGLTMRCACRMDLELFYGISLDYRIYPLHKNYEHAQWCSRNSSDKRNSACTYEDDGTATMFLKFNPLSFSPPKEEKRKNEVTEEENGTTDEEVVGTESNQKENNPAQEKERLPDYSLRSMIKNINHDTYAYRMMSGKFAYLTEQYFLNAIIGRLKNIYIHGIDKSLRELNIHTDGTAFFYSKVIEIKEKNLILYGSEKPYSRFVLSSVLEKAIADFVKRYGVEPQQYLKERTLMAAGFLYKRRNKFGKEYICIGRLCLFAITRNGLYADTLLERDVVEGLMIYAKYQEGQFLYPDTEDTAVNGILRFPRLNKEGYLYLYHKPREAQTPFLSCNGAIPSKEVVEEFIEEVKK